VRLYLIRHGRTRWNKEEVFRGTADVPLDEMGRREAEKVAEALCGRGIEVVYSSPLSRAKETAEAIAARCGAPLHIMEELRDLDFGEWQGLSRLEVQERYPDLYFLWEREPHRVVFPGGEDLDAVRKRATGALERIKEAHPHQGVALVSHRVVLKVLTCFLLGLDNSHFWHILQDTAAISCFRFDGTKWIVQYLNDTCHLRSLSPEEKADF